MQDKIIVNKVELEKLIKTVAKEYCPCNLNMEETTGCNITPSDEVCYECFMKVLDAKPFATGGLVLTADLVNFNKCMENFSTAQAEYLAKQKETFDNVLSNTSTTINVTDITFTPIEAMEKLKQSFAGVSRIMRGASR